MIIFLDPKTRQVIQRRYRSQMADQICYAVLCVFSYIAAGLEQKKRQQQQPQTHSHQQPHHSDHDPLNEPSLRRPAKLQIQRPPNKR